MLFFYSETWLVSKFCYEKSLRLVQEEKYTNPEVNGKFYKVFKWAVLNL